jgi:predicted nuclease of restriction endonuclease-like (RecB) superfamily
MGKKNEIVNPGIYTEIKIILEKAKEFVYKSVNFSMVHAYWNIGRIIFHEEQKGSSRSDYGSHLLEYLSKKLSSDFGRGFSVTNLKYMRMFYKAFQNRQTLSDQLSWSHYILLTKIEKDEARNFYLTECMASKWSVRELERQISSLLYERLALSKENEKILELSRKGHQIKTPSDLVKDPYVLEFLGLKQVNSYYEKDLEQALIDHLQEFLLELGKGFAFIARQMYVNFYKRTQMIEGENDPIGILLCSDKNEAVVKFTLPEDQKQIFASKYKLYLPSEEELKKELLREREILETAKMIKQGETRNGE